ncbi:MAG TPA: ATP-binding cassette domain-containing protein [Planctomycetaceae bacterium]|nr:ATP-binding cassette domain-containing protein [Planctomycetaceae bacterium]
MTPPPSADLAGSGAVADSSEMVLEVRGVSKRFRAGGRDVQALEQVSLRLRRGRVMGLIGPDGAGKTTLMRLCAGLLLPDAGEITAVGKNVLRDPLGVQCSIGYMPQRFGLYEDLTVQENLDLYADLQGVPYDQRPARYAELMKMTGLAPFTKRLAGNLSGGMKQKLGLACVLVRSPELLLLDEPTVGVDPVSRRELWGIVGRAVENEGTSVLLSTAYLDEAERCDELVILHEGEVLGDGTPAALTAGLEGRVFLAEVPAENRRRMQAQLSAASGVTDSIIQGSRVRFVMETAAPPDTSQFRSEGMSIAVVPAAPRLEDRFVDLLRKRESTSNRKSAVPVRPSRSAASEAMIEVRDVQRRFGSFYAVKGVTFDVARGEVFGLLGANGAGKSTLFRMLCGLLPASGGTLKIAGVDVRKTAAAARARLGYMSQKFSLYGNLTVAQNLRFFSQAYGLTGSRQNEQTAWAVEHFELQGVRDAASGDLPLGYKQRLALACSLMHEPDVLFLDEPTSGVDPLARREFWQRINELSARQVTVMVTTHFMEEAEYCDRVAIMVAGEVPELDTPDAIRARARSEQCPEPTMEDAFISVIESRQREIDA